MGRTPPDSVVRNVGKWAHKKEKEKKKKKKKKKRRKKKKKKKKKKKEKEEEEKESQGNGTIVVVESETCYTKELIGRFLRAVQAGLEDVVKGLLVEAGDSHEARKAFSVCRNEVGNTPLGIAAASHHESLFFLLLDYTGKGISVDLANNDGDTPLLLAALGRHTAMAKALVKRGANPRHRNKEGMTALEVAVWNEDKAMYTLLSSEHPHVIRIQAIVRGRQAFLKWNAVIKKRYRSRVANHLLRKACLEGDAKIVPGLLATGASINAGDPPGEGGDGSTPLLLATMGGYGGIVNLLLSAYDADVTLAATDGLHPLLAACATGRTTIVRSILASRNFDPRILNMANEAGCTPLLACVHAGHDDTAVVLLSHPQYGRHIDCNVTDAHGNTALHFAVQGGRGNSSTTLHRSCMVHVGVQLIIRIAMLLMPMVIHHYFLHALVPSAIW